MAVHLLTNAPTWRGARCKELLEPVSNGASPPNPTSGLSMRIPILVATTALLVAGSAQASVFDARALAKYDLSYVKCEAQLPQMKGHRDETYLSLYRIKADEKSLTRLAKVRSGADYDAEKKRAAQVMAKSRPVAASASNSIERECQALWGESQRVPKSK